MTTDYHPTCPFCPKPDEKEPVYISNFVERTQRWKDLKLEDLDPDAKPDNKESYDEAIAKMAADNVRLERENQQYKYSAKMWEEMYQRLKVSDISFKAKNFVLEKENKELREEVERLKNLTSKLGDYVPQEKYDDLESKLKKAVAALKRTAEEIVYQEGHACEFRVRFEAIVNRSKEAMSMLEVE